MRSVLRTVRVKGVQKIYRSNQGWRSIAGKNFYFKSGWEVNFARYLQFLKEQKQILEWEYEPQTFWFKEIKRGSRSYLPDFKVSRINGTHYWAEVKGYMDAKSKTKIKRFKKYYPSEELIIIDGEWFKDFQRKFPVLTEQWENSFTEGERACG